MPHFPQREPFWVWLTEKVSGSIINQFEWKIKAKNRVNCRYHLSLEKNSPGGIKGSYRHDFALTFFSSLSIRQGNEETLSSYTNACRPITDISECSLY